MRKSVISNSSSTARPAAHGEWKDIEAIAQVEITSEDAQFPIEQALGGDATAGWRAAKTGPQVIRLVFDEPQTLRRVHLHFVERESERSQEFALFAGWEGEMREVVRQQWAFSPHGSTEEIEEYGVELDGIRTLELRIDPDRSHDPKSSKAFASLQEMRVA
ncbi:MAG: hypothetical protein WDN23_01710 [Edaphobacter sp.]